MHNNPFSNIKLGLQHGSYNTPARDYRPIGDAREIETVDRNPYKYKYNAKEYQDELGLNVTAMDFRQYDNALGRFMNPDALSELAPIHTPYRFGFNNPVFWSDPTGLFEGSESMESFRYCPTCPESDNFDEFRDDPNTNYVYNDETGVVTEIIELPDVVAVGETGSSSIHTTTYLGWANNGIGGFGEGLAKTTSKGGSVAVWSKPQVRSFDGIKYGELKAKYYSNNWTGNQYTGKTYNVAKVIKKGSIVTTAVLGTIEVGKGVAQDYENYQNTGSTDGKNTAVAGGSVVGGATGAWAGAKTGAVIGGVVGSAIPILGTGAGAIVGGIIGGVVGGIIGSEVGSAVVEEAYTYK